MKLVSTWTYVLGHHKQKTPYKDSNQRLYMVSGISVTSMSYKSGLFEEASSSNSDSNPQAPGLGSPSALVVETVEHGFKRHYLIPSNLVSSANVAAQCDQMIWSNFSLKLPKLLPNSEQTSIFLPNCKKVP